MKKRFSIVLILIIALQSCGQNTDSIGQTLEGKWKWIGFYKNDRPQYDTLYTSINNKFEPEPTAITEIYIWTDSGTYVHRYQNNELIGIELSPKSRISEYILQDEQAGKVLDYELDSSEVNGEDPRLTASEQVFRIEGKTIIFNDFDLETKVTIEKITEDELVLKFEGGEASKFKKM